jgi:hypothetical protein
MVRKGCKEAVVTYFKFLFYNFPGVTEEHHKFPQFLEPKFPACQAGGSANRQLRSEKCTLYVCLCVCVCVCARARVRVFFAFCVFLVRFCAFCVCVFVFVCVTLQILLKCTGRITNSTRPFTYTKAKNVLACGNWVSVFMEH